VTEQDDFENEGTEAGAEPASGSQKPVPEPRVIDKRHASASAAAPETDEATSEGTGEELRQALDAARTEAAGYLDDLRRLKAEFDNYRKRVVKEQTALVDSASAALMERLLPVLDNFELALIAADRTKDYEALVRGVELVFSEFKEVLKREGLKAIDAHGAPFDPELHEAVMQEEGPENGKPLVAEVFRTGYTLNGRVVRPAMVKVRRA